ncbi:hypothetical protein DSO57_1033900 [Entomophthora muscae]|uniref:Uncharacterized protein n=1 Tax=Entomophthora muscae TaxID=34485 RepID=A0ACC2TZ13_9FUNG|nr:hypothetical protein DSO57_1033900 [Entomophthora muscae]
MAKDTSTIRELEKHLEQVKETIAHLETKEVDGKRKIPLPPPWMKSLIEAHHPVKYPKVLSPEAELQVRTLTGVNRLKGESRKSDSSFLLVDHTMPTIFSGPYPTPLPKIENHKNTELLVIDLNKSFTPDNLTGAEIVLNLMHAIGKKDTLEEIIKKMNSFKLFFQGPELTTQAKALFERGCKQLEVPLESQQNAWKVLNFTLDAWIQDEQHWPTNNEILCGHCPSYIQQFRSCVGWLAKGLDSAKLRVEIPYRALLTVLSAILIHRNPRFSDIPLPQVAQEIYATMAIEYKIIARKLKVPAEPLLLSSLLLARTYGFNVSLARTTSSKFPCRWPFLSKDPAKSSHEMQAFGIAAKVSAQIYHQLCQAKLFYTLP